MANQIETTFEIETRDGRMECFATRPAGSTALPPIILYMDAPGIREELRRFCRRIAEQDYYVLLPDLYYRLGRVRFEGQPLEEEVRKRVFEAMRSLDNGLVMQDTEAMLGALDADFAVRDGVVGCIGYCMSGQYVVSAAGTFPERFAASASLYGVGIVTDKSDSPHLLADRIRGELYLGFAERDDYVPDRVIPELQAALDRHGVSYQLDVWPGTGHGFCFPERDAYVEDAAEKVWGRVFELFKRRLV